MENAVKHGISHYNKNGKVLIKIDETSDQIIVLIQDNGQSCGVVKEVKSTGNGHRIMQDIIKLYQKRFSKNISTEIFHERSFEYGVGYAVQITLEK